MSDMLHTGSQRCAFLLTTKYWDVLEGNRMLPWMTDLRLSLVGRCSTRVRLLYSVWTTVNETTVLFFDKGTSCMMIGDPSIGTLPPMKLSFVLPGLPGFLLDG